MDRIKDAAKEYEYIAIQHDEKITEVLAAIDIVKKFIISRGLIIYGGTAIDYALRLKGDKIYPDELLAIPDLDFYSPDNYRDAVDLTNEIFAAGNMSARMIPGIHAEAIRVDAGDNHFVADVAYQPREHFDKIKTLTYQGMKLVHPDYQRIDLHLSLSHPYGGSPREAVFHRWTKDIKRLNLLCKYYPIDASTSGSIGSKTINFPRSYYLCSGAIAYAIIYLEYIKYIRGEEPRKRVIPANISATRENLNITCALDSFVIASDPLYIANKLGAEDLAFYEPYRYSLPARLQCSISGVNTAIYSTDSAMISSVDIHVNDISLHVVNVQYLMEMLLTRGNPVEIAHYVSLQEIITHVGDVARARGEIMPNLFSLSVLVYGSKNVFASYKLLINRVDNAVNDVPLMAAPRGYRPPGQAMPFDYEDNYLFRRRGRKISEEEFALYI